jgi:hypothetical protein
MNGDRTPGQLAWLAIVAALVLAGTLAGPLPAAAQAPAVDAESPGDSDPVGGGCVAAATGTLSVSAGELVAGQSAKLSWNVQAPANCGALRVEVEGLAVNRTGSKTVWGIERASYVDFAAGKLSTRYMLRVVFGSASRTLDYEGVKVSLPVDPATGRAVVPITANHHAALFVLAVGTADARVTVQPNVELDLTDRAPVFISERVHVSGGRTSRDPGARLYVRCTAWATDYVDGLGLPQEYCSSSPESFLVPSSGVRLSGFRIEGTDIGIPPEDSGSSFGIKINSYIDIVIANNEIYGWRGAGVRVNDQDDVRCFVTSATCPEPNPGSVGIHDNFIHHNRQDGREGYGVSIDDGAYALIERNVFDYNRHAIKASGEPGTGYLAYRNLVLEHGGEHEQQGFQTFYTHQFDVHGTDNCLGHLNCGNAGEHFDIRYNSFFYTRDNAFKLRGHPSHGVDVVSNVFAHTFLTGIVEPALGGYVDEMYLANNLEGINESGHYGQCDFDGDGVADDFLATGQTWWFRSPGRQWNYLNTSKARLNDLTLGDVTHDGVCDVVVDGVVVSGGRGQSTSLPGNIVWGSSAGNLVMWEMNGGGVVAETTPGVLPPGWFLAWFGNLTGDGSNDLLWRDEAGRVSLWDMSGGLRRAERALRTFGTLQGVGDFDGDGTDDLLWRDAAGQLAISFTGTPGSRATSDGGTMVPIGYRNVRGPFDPAWVVRGVGDFDGDGRADILFHNASGGGTVIWFMNGASWVGDRVAKGLPRARIAGVADFDNDGRADVLWQDGSLTIWFGGETSRVATIQPGASVVGAGWTIADVRDFDRDGRADLLWQEARTGRVVVWILDGGRFLREEYPRLPLLTWRLVSGLAASR